MSVAWFVCWQLAAAPGGCRLRLGRDDPVWETSIPAAASGSASNLDDAEVVVDG